MLYDCILYMVSGLLVVVKWASEDLGPYAKISHYKNMNLILKIKLEYNLIEWCDELLWTMMPNICFSSHSLSH